MNDTNSKTESTRRIPTGDRLQALTQRNFDLLVLAGNGPIAVEFMSYGCEHCRAIEPALLQVADALRGRESIYRVNIAAERGLARTFEITGTPTFVMFRDGQEAGRVAGPSPDVASVLAAVTGPFE